MTALFSIVTYYSFKYIMCFYALEKMIEFLRHDHDLNKKLIRLFVTLKEF